MHKLKQSGNRCGIKVSIDAIIEAIIDAYNQYIKAIIEARLTQLVIWHESIAIN